MEKHAAMMQINSLIKEFDIDLTDYYSSQENSPLALMLGCEKCAEYANNGCGVSEYGQITYLSGVGCIEKYGRERQGV